MKSNVMIVLTALAAFGLAGSCSENENTVQEMTPKTIKLTAEAPQAIAGSNDFGIALFKKVAEQENKNLMLSPLSASVALTMLLNGCGGDTYAQLQGTLNYPARMKIGDINDTYKSLVEQLLNADPKVKLALANAIFYRTGFTVKDPFLAVMDNNYNAEIKGLDFSAPSALTAINKWASDNTNKKIPEVLDDIEGDAVMFIMNALYFNGDWSNQFDKSKTQDRPFYPDGGNTVNVSTMNGKVGSKTVYGNGWKAIEMPYGRTNFTMVVIVPEGTINAFNVSFTPESWNQLTSDLDEIADFDKLTVIMPKFKFDYEKYLNDQLQSMGMIDAFSPYKANLSGISDQSIYVDFVKQNTFVEVDEEGTEAAAVTTIGIKLTSMPSQPDQFVIDKSFIFAIRERTTNTLLFIGQVVDPR